MNTTTAHETHTQNSTVMEPSAEHVATREIETGCALGSMLHDAVNSNNITGYNGIHMLMEFAPPMHFLNEQNMTPLHCAVLSGRPEVVEVLLSYGAELHFTGGEKNQTPLEMARCHGTMLGNKYNNSESMTHHEYTTYIAMQKCMKILDEAEDEEAMKGNGDNTKPPLRVNARIVVCKMEDHEMAESMNGTVGILQHWHEDIEKWRVIIETKGNRGPAYICPRFLEIKE